MIAFLLFEPQRHCVSYLVRKRLVPLFCGRIQLISASELQSYALELPIFAASIKEQHCSFIAWHIVASCNATRSHSRSRRGCHRRGAVSVGARHVAVQSAHAVLVARVKSCIRDESWPAGRRCRRTRSELPNFVLNLEGRGGG